MSQERHLKYAHIMWNFAPSKVHQHNSLHMVATHLSYCTNIEMAVMLPEIVQLFADKKNISAEQHLQNKPPGPSCLVKYTIVQSFHRL